MMKRAFTLIELLIVIVILAILVSITFRLGTVAETDRRRTATVVKLQKIENCLSGYYAAFGSYPPVKKCGYASVNHKADDNGDQREETEGGDLKWVNVKAACRCQPFGCEYPPSDEEEDAILEYSDTLRDFSSTAPKYKKSSYYSIYQSGFAGPDVKSGAFADGRSNGDWKHIKLFKFGLMSFLLPRYLFMMSVSSDKWTVLKNFKQWTDNNDAPCDPFYGDVMTWDEVRDYAFGSNGDTQRKDLARVANIPSQAVCARWMPNLESACRGLVDKTFFGIKVVEGTLTSDLSEDYPPDPQTHYEPGRTGGTAYKNGFITMWDGWENEFYYHSDPPYQSYVVWSSGADGKTFPPWIPLDTLGASDRQQAVEWTADDIMKMSH